MQSRRVTARIVAMVGVVFAMACNSSTASDRTPIVGGMLLTDHGSYVARRISPDSPARYQFTIVARFENRSAITLYLGRCYPDSPQPMFGVGFAASVEQSAYDPVWGCVGHDKQFEMIPGSVRVDTFQISGPNEFDGYTNTPIGVLEGTYRLRFDVRLAKGDGAPEAPDSLRLSNTFDVRISQE